MFRLRLISRFIFVLWVSAFALTLQAKEMVSIDRADVNMRSGASTRHASQWTLSRGYPLEVIGRKGKWLRVRDFEKDTGWVFSPLVSKKSHVIVKASVANIRSAPNTRSRILGKGQYGEVFRSLKQVNGWTKVQLQSGPQGWVSRPLVWGW